MFPLNLKATLKMQKKEILEALAAVNLDLVQAEQLLNRAGVAAHSALNALYAQWKDTLLGEQIANLPPSIAAAHQRLEQIRAVTEPAPNVPAEAAPQSTKQAIDLSDPLLRDVPQSSASRLPVSAPAPAPTAAAGPTPEVSRKAALPASPTLENPTRAISERDRFEEQLGHFTGVGSLFSRYLSPEVICSGKSFLKPGVAGLQQYSDDLLQLTPARLVAWPTSFYRDSVDSTVQFMITTDQAVVIVPMLPKSDQIPMVVQLPLVPGSQLVPVTELKLMDLLVLKESVEAELKRLSDLVQL